MTLSKNLLTVICVLIFYSNLSAQLKPGDVHPQAKVLEVDELHDFHDGVARIRKGQSWALIDSSGNFVVPFNKWMIRSDSKSNLLVVEGKVGYTRKFGLINTAGKLIEPCNYDFELFDIDLDGYAYINKGKVPYFINANGNKITSAYPTLILFSAGSFHENLVPGKQIGAGAKQGYLNRKGEIAIPFQFDLTFPFFDGMAVVGKKNEFGEMKYGYIDKTGKIVIPCQFSIKPGAFNAGRAMVEPVKKDEFSYAFINKQGQIVLKIDKAPDGSKLFPRLNADKPFNNGFAEWGSTALKMLNTWLLDTAGNFTTLEDQLRSVGVDIKMLYQWEGMQQVQNGFARLHNRKTVSNSMGVWDIKNKRTLPPIYDIRTHRVYDPVSRLIKASCYNADTKKKLEGYINEQGVFVIVKGEGGKW